VNYTCICEPGFHGHDCKTQFANAPALSVGDGQLSDKNFSAFAKKTKQFLIGVSSSQCAGCALYESEYSIAMDKLRQLNVPFLRIDAVHQHQLISRLGVKTLPALVFIASKGKKRLVFTGEHAAALIVEYVEKQLDPPTGKDTIEETEQLRKFVISRLKHKATLVLALGVFKGKHYRDTDEYEDFLEAAKVLQQHEHVYPLVVTNPLVVFGKKTAKFRPTLLVLRLEPSVWLLEHKGLSEESIFQELIYFLVGKAPNIVSVKSGGSAASQLDLTEGLDYSAQYGLDGWVLRQAVPLVGTIHEYNFVAYQRLGLPMLLVFIQNATLPKDYVALHQAAVSFRGQISVAVADCVAYKDQMKTLGIGNHFSQIGETTKAAMTMNTNDAVVVEPLLFEDVRLLTKVVIEKFCNDFLLGRLAAFDPSRLDDAPDKPLPKFVKGVSEDFDPASDHVVPLSNGNFSKVVYSDETRDVVVMFYQSRGCESCRRIAPHYKRAALRFSELNISPKNLVLARLDLSLFRAPPEFHLSELPSIAMIAAFAKTPPFSFFTEVAKVADMMRWVERTSGRDWKLGNLAHLSPEDQALYIEQVTALEKRRLASGKDEL